MKKIIALTLTFILVFSLVSCKLAEKEEAEPTAILTEEPTPEPSPTVLYICNGHEWRTDEYLSDVGDMDITDTFKYYVNSSKYADYAFCFRMSLITPEKADATACTVEEVERLTQLGYNVWLTGEDKTIIQGIASQKQLQDFPYDLESFGYRIRLSTNEPNAEPPDEWKTIVVQLQS